MSETEKRALFYEFEVKQNIYNNKVDFVSKHKNEIADWLLKHYKISITDDMFSICGLNLLNEYSCSTDCKSVYLKTIHLTKDYNNKITDSLVVETEIFVAFNNSMVSHIASIIDYANKYAGKYPIAVGAKISQN